MSKSSEVNPAKAFDDSIVLSSVGIFLGIVFPVFTAMISFGLVWGGSVNADVALSVVHWVITGISVVLLLFSYGKFSIGLAATKGRRGEFKGVIRIGALFMSILLVIMLLPVLGSIIFSVYR